MFVDGFCAAKSIPHPYINERFGPAWVMRDEPPKKQDPRTQEFIVSGCSPQEGARIVRERATGRFMLCNIHGPGEDGSAIRDEYKSLGFRLLRREPFFYRSVLPVAGYDSPLPIRRIRTPEENETLRKAVGARQLQPEDLTDPDPLLRMYAAYDGERIVGHVRSGRARHQGNWVSNMYVEEAYRRRGLARALMLHMLEDDARFGVRHSVLLSSGIGAKFYPTIAYQQVGLLQMFSPMREA